MGTTEPQCHARATSTWTSCPCPSCRRQHQRVRKLATAGLLPASPEDQAWAEIDRLLGLGWTPLAIASASGLSERTVRGALRVRDAGRPRGLIRGVATAILAHGDPTAGAIGVTGSTRRLRALSAIGWDLDHLSTRSAMAIATISTIRSGTRTTRIRASHAATIAALYADLSMTTGPSEPARVLAVRRRWAPPLAWDDDAIDDPDATPTGERYRPARVIDQIHEVEDTGVSGDRAVADRLGISVAAVQQARNRARKDAA